MTKKRQSKRQTKIPVFRAIPYPGRGLAGRGKTPQKLLLRSKTEALRHLTVLLVALEEADAFDPAKPSNQPRPALWLNDPGYQRDLNSLLVELRELRTVLVDKASNKGSVGKRIIGTAASAATKFIDAYADALGKGAAALTIGAVGALLLQLGLSKEVLASVWDRLKFGR